MFLILAGKPMIVWDLDGNLIDSVHNTVSGCPKDFADVLREAYDLDGDKYKAALEYYVGPGCGVRVEVQYPTCLDMLGLSKDGSENFVQEYLERIYSTVYPLYPDVVLCMEQLKSMGYENNCISTSMKSEFTFRDGREKDHLTETVRKNSLDRYMRHWFGGTREQANKLYHKEKILQAFDVSDEWFRNNSCLIGDAENDMKVAKGWGVVLPIYINRRKFPVRKIEKDLEGKEVDPKSVFIASSLDAVPDVVQNYFRI